MLFPLEIFMKALNIILVDDNNHFRNSAINFINNNLNFKLITWASSSEEAMGKILNYNFDLVILDLVMNGLNGFETTKKIRSFDKNIKIIITTLSNNTEYKKQSLAAGANEFISKQNFAEQLLPAINKIFYND